MARPSKVDQWLTEDGLKLLRYFKQSGMTDAQIAEKIGIHERVLRKWKEKYEPIKTALKNGKEFAIAEAYAALKWMFRVQTLKETVTQTWTDADGNEHTTITVKEKEIPPDKTAAIFFMKSQAGWRDNVEIVDNADSERVFEMLKQTQEYAESLPELPEEEDEDEDDSEN
jgi:transcriptional regulator with XRE-family HTH domain